MGKKGNKSRRGIGEKDDLVRQCRISVWVTKKDVVRLDAVAKKLGISKGELVIRLLRILFDIFEDDSG